MTYTVTCPVCGASFETNKSQQKFCGYECSHSHWLNYHKEYYHKNHIPKPRCIVYKPRMSKYIKKPKANTKEIKPNQWPDDELHRLAKSLGAKPNQKLPIEIAIKMTMQLHITYGQLYQQWENMKEAI